MAKARIWPYFSCMCRSTNLRLDVSRRARGARHVGVEELLHPVAVLIQLLLQLPDVVRLPQTKINFLRISRSGLLRISRSGPGFPDILKVRFLTFSRSDVHVMCGSSIRSRCSSICCSSERMWFACRTPKSIAGTRISLHCQGSL